MNLNDLFDERREQRDHWDGCYKIPWNDPAFSRRMLAEHLSQNHDRASRRQKLINEHVVFIHERLLNERPSRILDLGCGPGFYTEKLAVLGHLCRGIDFSPASIDYAVKNTAFPDRCEYLHDDILTASFGDHYDLVTFLFGEFNVFPSEDASTILAKVYRALKPGGRVLLETQSPELVRQIGETEDSWFKAAGGLFSDKPHICLMTNRWYPDDRIAAQEFIVIDAASAEVTEYRSTTRAYDASELKTMFERVGFYNIVFPESWDSGHFGLFRGFMLVQAEKK
ncbi:MAG: class I SAM-dependent methyltransferase [Candidatus Zixiibacteriota bacterium]